MYDVLKEMNNPPKVRTTTLLEVVLYGIFVAVLYHYLGVQMHYVAAAIGIYLIGMYFWDKRKIKEAANDHKRLVLSQAVREHTQTLQALNMVRNQLPGCHFELGELRVLYERNASNIAWTQDISDFYAEITLVTRMLQTELQVREDLHDEFNYRMNLLEAEDLPVPASAVMIDAHPWNVV